MKSGPFSLLIDGSNDTSVDKLNPLTLRIHDVSKRQVTMQLLDMCTNSGKDCGTASIIFGKDDSVVTTLNIPWRNCVGFGVDNTSVNVGRHHSIKNKEILHATSWAALVIYYTTLLPAKRYGAG